MRTGFDPGFVKVAAPGKSENNLEAVESERAVQDIDELMRDQIRKYIRSKFKGHALARLVAAVL